MRKLRIGALAVFVTALVTVPVTPAHAVDHAFCTLEVVEILDPGMGRTPVPQTFKSEPGSVKLSCQGKAMGGTITGGTVDHSGNVTGPFGGATCGGGTGEGMNTFTFETDAGQKVLTEKFTFSFVMGQGEVSTDSASGVFTARPATGDCLNSPLTRALLVVAFKLQT